MKKEGIVYKAKNGVTGEEYIGITTHSIERRTLDHLEKALRGEPGKFYEAIGTYGPEAFSWEQVDTAETANELAQKEANYIYIYNCKEDGYNSDRGGGIKKNVYQYDSNVGNILYTYPDLESAGNAVSAHKTSISKACLGEIKTCKGYCWSYTLADNFKPEPDSRLKQVFQFNSGGKFIGKFISVSKASEATGINKASIAKCCRGEYHRAGEYFWKYSE
jgi:hypothetical protein